jgi:hypothetical protein
LIPFVFAIDDTAVIELTEGVMRIWKNDALVTRPTVSAATVNGNFLTDVSGWTDVDEAGGVSDWIADNNGSLRLYGNDIDFGGRAQLVAVGAYANVKHSLRIIVEQGTCVLSVGLTSAGEDLVEKTTLLPGVHSIAFTPSADFFVRLTNSSITYAIVSSVYVDIAGALSFTFLQWATEQQLNDIRYDQSGDVLFVACSGLKQKRIERRANDSWSVVDYYPLDGPFRSPNTTTTTLAVSSIAGSEVTCTASKPVFKSTHVGALFKLTSQGQNVTASLTATGSFTDPIRVTGVGAERTFTRVISGTWVGTVTLQRSVGELDLWTDVVGVTNGTVAYNDTFDNQIIYYRIIFTARTSGTVDAALNYAVGSITGIGRVKSVASSTSAVLSHVKSFGSLTATADWQEGEWSDARGFPSAVALHGGRLWWAGKDKQWGSISDAYSSFDEDQVGDAGPISRSIGKGPVDKIRWLISGDHLIMGGQGAEFAVKSSALDEPITPTNYNLKKYTGRGSGALAGIEVDANVLFVDRSGARVFELTGDQYGRYAASDITGIVPEVCTPSAVRMVVQRLPDTRVHVVLSDGTVALLVYDRQEEVRCWIKIETDGLIKDAVVLPTETGEDSVYYLVQRTVGGNPVNFIEKWAKESEAVGGTTNKMADAGVVYAGAATATITGLSHLEGRTVVCWANGVDRGTFVVASGAITLPAPTVTNAVVGLTYRGRFKSTKLGYNVQGSSSLVNLGKQRVDHVALILANTHAQGLSYGTDFDFLDDLPLYEAGALVGADTVHTTYNGPPIELNGTLDINTQLCLEANAPRPCTVLGVVISMT